MIAFLLDLQHIIPTNSLDVSGFLSKIEVIAGIITSMAGGVCAIKGIGYLNSLKEKTRFATFSFWTQFSIRLRIIRNRLDGNPAMINNLYAEKTREKWNGELRLPNMHELEELYGTVKDTLDFMLHTTDQMPAYSGWTEDYNRLLEFFDRIIRYDIRKPDELFCYFSDESMKDRNNICSDICEIMDRLIQRINEQQEHTEQLIYTNRIKNLLCRKNN